MPDDSLCWMGALPRPQRACLAGAEVLARYRQLVNEDDALRESSARSGLAPVAFFSFSRLGETLRRRAGSLALPSRDGTGRANPPDEPLEQAEDQD